MIRAILFDAVGTLLWARPAVAEAYFLAGRQFGSTLTREEVESRFRDCWRNEDRRVVTGESLRREATSQDDERERWRRVVSRVFTDVRDAGASENLFDHLWLHFSLGKNWALFDDVASAWRSLEAAGYILGLASNFDDRLEVVCRDHPPLADCRRLFISSQIGFPKPDRRFFQCVQDQLRLSPSEFLLVGDDPVNDLQGARNAGWQAILIDRGGDSPGGQTIRSLSELPALLINP